MRFKISFFIMLFHIVTYAQLREGFVYIKDIIPDIKVELRYFSTNNFIGKPIEGYKANKLILSKNSGHALKNVQNELVTKGYCLKIFDAYRPQRAVNHFMQWAKDLNDTI